MPYTVLPITFAVPARPELPGLIMEQAPWSGAGIVTRLDLVKALSNALTGSGTQNSIDCGMDGDAYLSGLYIYLFNPSLSYQCDITHGDLGTCIVQEVQVREMVEFKLDTEAAVKYPVHQFISADWGAETWDSSGGVTSDPAIAVSGQDVTISKPVYGTVIIEYKTIRHARILRVLPRANAVENIYDSYAWARWNGGVELLKLEPPEGAEENYLDDTDCIWGKRFVGHDGPDDKDIPEHDDPNKTVELDYCSQCEIVSNLAHVAGDTVSDLGDCYKW